MLPRFISLLALASLSIATGCPFAQLRKDAAAGDIPELSNEKLAEMLAKIRKFAPNDELPELGKHSAELKDDL
ncbi:hypothetical protein N7490_004815 [Penicillium lividum]|nr:hypothetical protein N7490_004815 [Penicillium lividum]